MIKKSIIFVLSFILLCSNIISYNVLADGEKNAIDITAKSAVIMEPSTGKVIYEKNSHEKLRPASVTKIMTLLLIYDAVESKKINWDDEVVVSDFASSMGGSQVFLEANEVQTVATLTKCIAVASANDGAVAMAEYIAGSEDAFAGLMNERAKELGMNDTNFINASGLDEDGHYTSAYDIALMSRELTTKYPDIFNLSTIWMDKIIHKTRRGEEEFGLTNTNKLLNWYNGATGLKTGSTGLAKYCLSGTATRDGMDLIAVVMAAPDYKTRFREVMKMFDYGFAVCKKYEDNLGEEVLSTIKVKNGTDEFVEGVAKQNFKTIFVNKGFDKDKIQKKIEIVEEIQAPIVKNQKLGELIYSYDGKELGRVEIVSNKNITKAYLSHYMQRVFFKYFM
jgi:D-alanyl-D-alanine carboxypeptidase (penicillin-binding protein 5/6)